MYIIAELLKALASDDGFQNKYKNQEIIQKPYYFYDIYDKERQNHLVLSPIESLSYPKVLDHFYKINSTDILQFDKIIENLEKITEHDWQIIKTHYETISQYLSYAALLCIPFEYGFYLNIIIDQQPFLAESNIAFFQSAVKNKLLPDSFPVDSMIANPIWIKNIPNVHFQPVAFKAENFSVKNAKNH